MAGKRFCESCIFWSRLTERHPAFGECRVDAPAGWIDENAVLPAPLERGLTPDLVGRWPMTRKDSWCGRGQFLWAERS